MLNNSNNFYFQKLNMTNCEVKFDNNANATFISGQMLTGSVTLTLTEKKKFRGKFSQF